MAGGSVTIRKDVSGTLVVDITSAAGGTPTFYSDAALTASVSFPDSITTSKTYYIGVSDQYVLSVKRNGLEIANSPDGTRSFRLEDTHLSVSPGPDASNTEAASEGASLTASNAFTGNNTFTVASGVPVTITNTGSGNSLVVEDSASTDSTPFVIDASGNVGIGTSAPSVMLNVVGGQISQDRDAATTMLRQSTAAAQNRILQRRSSGTLASPTIVSSGDAVGDFLAQGYDGSTFRDLGSLLFAVDATPGASDMPGRFSVYLTPNGSATIVERLKIDNAGLITGTGTSLGAWTAYTPTLGGTGWAIGDGTAAGYYCQIGKMVHFKAVITLGGTSTAGSGNPTISLPVSARNVLSGQTTCNGILRDASASLSYIAFPSLSVGSSVVTVRSFSTAGVEATLNSTTPFTWTPADADWIGVAGTYEAA